LLEDHVDREQDPADELPAPEKRPVTQRGDLWTRTHRLLCGDANCAADVTRLMARQRAAMTITDAPYNLTIRTILGRGKTKHREFVQGSG